jgi:RimJ/RimL family protein N-acetyltransferase
MHTKDTKITTRKFVYDDITDEYIRWINDYDVVKYSELRHTKQNFKTALSYLDSVTKNNDKMFAIILNNTKHIGNVTLRFDRYNLSADISIMIGDKKNWGYGYAKEVIAILLCWLKGNTNMTYITAGTMAINKPMISTFESLDFELSGRICGYFKVNDSRIDALFFRKKIR